MIIEDGKMGKMGKAANGKQIHLVNGRIRKTLLVYL
nr:MAG TPA: hypothetical protein [Bacteriophage sp.]